MEFKDYYTILGVERGATQDEIKRAYRRLARKFHPDVSKEKDAEVRFKEMKEAYEVLKDPEKRSAYDQFGANWQAGQEFRPPPDWEQREYSKSGGGFTDAGEFSDFFEALFGRGRGRQAGHGFRERPVKGSDIEAQISISLDDAMHGASRRITLNVPETGPDGWPVSRERTLNVRIPAGVKAGQRIRLEGQGSPAMGKAPAGDLYLIVQFDPHPLYRVQDRDIYLALPVTPWEAALGRTVKAPTLSGKVDLKIPAGSGSGTKLRLKGRGLPGKPPGDQYVELRIDVSKDLTERARSLYEELESEQKFNPRERLGV